MANPLSLYQPYPSQNPTPFYYPPHFCEDERLPGSRLIRKSDGSYHLIEKTPAEVLGEQLASYAKRGYSGLQKILSAVANKFPSFPIAHAAEVSKVPEVQQAPGIQVRKNVFISRSIPPNLLNEIKEFLDQVEANPVGAKLLQKIENLPVGKIVIRFVDDRKAFLAPLSLRDPSDSAKMHVVLSSDEPTVLSAELKEIPMPKYLILFDKLNDAYLRLTEQQLEFHAQNCDPLLWVDDLLCKVIGLPVSFQGGEEISENAARRAVGLPQRLGFMAYSSMSPMITNRFRILKSLFDENPAIFKQYLGKVPLEKLDFSLNKGIHLIQIKIGNRNKDFWRVVPLIQLNQDFKSEHIHYKFDPNEPETKDVVKQFLPASERDKKFQLIGFYLLFLSTEEISPMKKWSQSQDEQIGYKTEL